MGVEGPIAHDCRKAATPISTERMTKSAQNAVYNSPSPHMPSSFPPYSSYCRLLVVLLLAGTAWAGDWDKPEEQLAAKIAAVTGPGAVAVEVNNRSSLSKNDVETIRRGILDRLSASGLKLVNAGQAAATVQISLSEDLQNYLWIARISQGTNAEAVVMVSLSRPASSLAGHESPTLNLRKLLLWSSEERILDAIVINGSFAQLAVLSPSQVKIFKLQGERWLEEQSLPISYTRTWPRDPRGHVVLRKDHLLDVYLPGVLCHSSSAIPLSLNCHESDDPWPLGTEQFGLNAFFAPARNFFTGALSSGISNRTTAPAFYSAAPLPREKYTLWILASVDGQVHLLDGVNDQIAGKLGWGSDLATVHSTCESGWQVLATKNGSGATDSIQAFELPDREPVAIGQSLELPGGVTSMWTSPEGNTAVAVARNSETGKYEAYLITISCGR